LILEEYIKHRQEVVRRRTQFELNKAKDRAHILEGLMIALRILMKLLRRLKLLKIKKLRKLI